jgi:hypothetical protein
VDEEKELALDREVQERLETARGVSHREERGVSGQHSKGGGIVFPTNCKEEC